LGNDDWVDSDHWTIPAIGRFTSFAEQNQFEILRVNLHEFNDKYTHSGIPIKWSVHLEKKEIGIGEWEMA